jgi:hypothetical protein
VTAARVNARPSRTEKEFRVTETRDRIVPTNVEYEPIVELEPTAQKTLLDSAPLVSATVEYDPVTTVLTVCITHCALGFRVRI